LVIAGWRLNTPRHPNCQQANCRLTRMPPADRDACAAAGG